MAALKQSTAFTRLFKMISSTDHFTAKTGAAPVVNISKAGAAFGAAAGVVTEITSGWYKVAFTTVDTGTLGDLAVLITGTGADDTDFCDQVTANILGDTLPASVAGAVGSVTGAVGSVTGAVGSVTAAVTISAGTGAGQLDFTSGVVKTNLVQILGTALTETAGQIAAAFKQFFNIASPTSTANLITAVTTVTTTTTATNLTTNNDKTGYGLSAAAVQAVWDALTSALTTVGSIGKMLVTNVNAVLSTLATPTNITAGTITTVTNLTNAPTAGDLTATMKTSVTTAATAATPTAAAVTGAVGSVTAVVSANLTQILGTALTETAGQLAAAFKKFFNIGAPASTMDALTLVATATNLTNAPTAGDLTATMKTSVTTAASAATPVATVSGDLSATMKTSVTTAVLDVAIAGHLGAGTVGLAINSAGGAGDPWNTPLPGAYAVGTAGKILSVVSTEVDAVNTMLASRNSNRNPISVVVTRYTDIAFTILNVNGGYGTVVMTYDDGMVETTRMTF